METDADHRRRVALPPGSYFCLLSFIARRDDRVDAENA
jgi:hypothetical protein